MTANEFLESLSNEDRERFLDHIAKMFDDDAVAFAKAGGIASVEVGPGARSKASSKGRNMANDYNSNPIYIDTTFTGGWRSKQTLNSGTLRGYGTTPAQPGIRPTQITWVAPGASGSYSVTDPNDSTVLAKGTTPASYAGPDPEYTFPATTTWRDFNVTISDGELLIYYRI